MAGVKLLATCWVLGDKYQVPLFTDLAMLELLFAFSPNHHFGFTPEEVKYVFANTQPGAPLQRVFVNQCVAPLLNGEITLDVLKEECGFDDDIMLPTMQGLVELMPSNTTFHIPSWETYMLVKGEKKHHFLGTARCSDYPDHESNRVKFGPVVESGGSGG